MLKLEIICPYIIEQFFFEALAMDKDKDTREFVSLLTSNQGKINSYILTLVPNYSDCADIMQETTKKMWDKFSEFEIGTDFLSWGLSIAHYRVLEYRRKQKKSKQVGLSDDVLERLSVAAKKSQDKSNEYASFLKKCFTLLNDIDKQIILLRYHENLKVKEIAERVGKSVQSIYRNISRIHDSLLRCVKMHAFEAGDPHV